MIKFDTFTLKNGLRGVVCPCKSDCVVVNIIYNIGSKDENEHKTGLAHLFEHLMFGGSKNIDNYDNVLQKVGGINNAFTSPDVTNYYCMVPKSNIETAFWLESDRMLSLSFDPEVLKIQKKVVIEEYKEGLNKPYGEVWRNLCALMYKKNQYRWPTIGLDISHIENVTLDDVKDFFFKYYRPNNAVLVVAGGVNKSDVQNLTEKWFGDIPKGEKIIRDINKEPPIKEIRHLKFKQWVPMNAIFKAFHMSGRFSEDFYKTDLLSSILGHGKSSRLYDLLVNKKTMFSNIESYVTEFADTSLLCISGYMNGNVSHTEAEKAIDEVIQDLQSNIIENEELEKVKNGYESHIISSNTDMLNVAQDLAFYAVNGYLDKINDDIRVIKNVTTKDIFEAAIKVTDLKRAGTLYYEMNEN